MEISYRKSGDQVYARVFSDGPFRWEVRFRVSPGVADLDSYMLEASGDVEPIDGRADLPPIVLQQPPENAASYMLYAMPLVDGLPMDGSATAQPDYRRFVRLR